MGRWEHQTALPTRGGGGGVEWMSGMRDGVMLGEVKTRRTKKRTVKGSEGSKSKSERGG